MKKNYKLLKLLLLCLGLFFMYLLLNLNIFRNNESMWHYMWYMALLMTDIVFTMGVLFFIVFDYLNKTYEYED